MRIVYDAISPITGNQCVMQEYLDSEKDFFCICMESGYYTFRKACHENTEFNEFLQSMDENYVSLAFFAPDRVWWYPILETGEKFCLYPIVKENKIKSWGISSSEISDIKNLSEVMDENFEHQFEIENFVEAFDKYNELENE